MAATAVPFGSRHRPRRRSPRRVGDDRLVARVRAGDDDAFEAIYDRYYRGLLAFCRHMLGSRQEAEDALQHSFASAYRALRRGDAAVELRPWLYTIARNRCLSALRSRRDELDIDRVDLERASLDGLPVQIQRRAELRELVEDLQRLPDDQRAALVLFELGDHSHDEIAAVLGVRREKVKALVFQARSGLLRARRARDASCLEIREQLASLLGGLPKRGIVRAHVDRCAACAAFEREVRRQRSALAAILPVAPTAGLKASVLGFALGGGGGAAAITGATVGGAGGGAVAGALGTAGVATVAGGFVTSTTNIAPGLGALSAKGLVTKLLTVVAVAGGTGEARHATPQAVAVTAPAVTVSRAALLAQASAAVTVHRHAAASRPIVIARPARPPAGGAADPIVPLTVPAPDATHADVAPAPAAAPAPLHAPVQPAAAPPAAPTPAAAPDPEPAAIPGAPDPAPAATATDPAGTTTATTAPATLTTSTTTAAPTATATADPDPQPSASTLSTTETAPAPTAPAAAASDAQG
jgi:RNA polymerase sigma factor (sigma-70 family)